ncbi:hypothetical protein OEZ86_000704 [Tetradesmus obliquus]|nr:hypothetical protein OEZ86_000704 [Tetradesmus obliquus]
MNWGSRTTAELVIVIVSLGGFICYHVWLFGFRGRGYKVSAKYHDFFQAGKLARSIWAEACATDEKDAILGVQQARNAMTACTYLATISVALATAGITIIFDDTKIQRIQQLALNDAMLRHLSGSTLVQPTLVVALALGSLYASFICFAQSVRLYVHTGFYIRACTSRFNPGTLTVNEAKKVCIHAGMAFSVGLRLFYLFIPLVMWSIGCTALLISSVVMTTMIAYMDHFDMTSPELPDEDDLEAAQSLTARQPPAGPAAASAGRAAAGSPDVLELAATAGSYSLGPVIAAALAADGSVGSTARTSTARQGGVQVAVGDGAAAAADIGGAGAAGLLRQQ